MSPQLFSNTYNKTHDKLKANLKWKYLWKRIHKISFGTIEQQPNLDNLKNKIETFFKFGAH
jgi:hypothetical protein